LPETGNAASLATGAAPPTPSGIDSTGIVALPPPNKFAKFLALDTIFITF
jgi:hypothetical protein